MSINSDYVGTLGENIVANYLRSEGYEVEIGYGGDRYFSHIIDLCVKKDEVILFFADVKTKQCREKFRRIGFDTGIDSDDFKKYWKLQKKSNIPVFQYFVDFYLGDVYGNFLDNLNIEEDIYDENNKFVNHYPDRYDGITYFRNSRMEHIFDLTEDEIAEIGRYSKKYEYRDYKEFYALLKRKGLKNIVE